MKYKRWFFLILTLTFAIIGWTVNNVLADQAGQNSLFQNEIQQITINIADITKNLVTVSAQLGQVNLVNMNATIQNIDGRTSRIEHKLNLQ